MKTYKELSFEISDIINNCYAQIDKFEFSEENATKYYQSKAFKEIEDLMCMCYIKGETLCTKQ